jgi:aminoglycoside 3-N-acetyltransferase I
MDAAITIRRLTVDDAHLAQRTFQVMADVFEEGDGELSSAYVAALLAQTGFWAFAAVRDGVPVGGITAHALPMTRNEATELFIYDLAVHPAYQRQGIGRALVDALQHEGQAAGIRVSFVPADVEDTHALDFYRALGGTPADVTIFTFEQE